MHVCMYEYMSTRHKHAYVHICTHTSMLAGMHYIHAYVCICTRNYIHTNVSNSDTTIHAYMRTYITHVRTYVRTCVSMYVYVCVCLL